jgi:hypothetical protein
MDKSTSSIKLSEGDRSTASSGSYRGTCGMLFLFLACFILFALRNLEPIFSPNIYAEDGTWMGKIMQHGIMDTTFAARDAFPVLGLIILEWLALTLNDAFFNGSIFLLPQSIFIVANTFCALVAITPVVAFRGALPLWIRLGLVVCVVFMPTGSSGNEIFGRILNLGFLFPLIVVCSIHVARRTPSGTVFALQLIFLLVAALTFPVCLAIMGVWLLVEHSLFVLERDPSATTSNWTSARSIAVLAVLALSVISMRPDVLSSQGGASLPYSQEGLIDFAFGRLVAYPFVAGFYTALSDWIVIAIVLLLIALVIAGLIRSQKSERELIALLILGFGVYWVATAVMRSGFTSLFGTFKNTYPDRYVYGLNVMAAWVAVTLAYVLWQKRSTLWPLGALSIALLCLNILGMHSRTFQMSKPQQPMQQYGDIRSMTCKMVAGTIPPSITVERELVHIPIYPITEDNLWQMVVPRKVWDNTVVGQCL